jgi:hypothetical protein
MSIIVSESTIASSSQFLGTEFQTSIATTRAGFVLQIMEVDLQMGSESKTWTVQKITAAGTYVLATNTDTTTAQVFTDPAVIGTILSGTDYISIVTANATSAMHAKIYAKEIPSEAHVQTMRLLGP